MDAKLQSIFDKYYIYPNVVKDFSMLEFREFFKGFFLKYESDDLATITSIRYDELITAVLLLENPYNSKSIFEILKNNPLLCENNGIKNLFPAYAKYLEDKYLQEGIIKTNKNLFLGLIYFSNVLGDSFPNIDKDYYTAIINLIKYRKFIPILEKIGPMDYDNLIMALKFVDFWDSMKEDYQKGKTKDILKYLRHLEKTNPKFYQSHVRFIRMLKYRYDTIIHEYNRSLALQDKNNAIILELLKLLNKEGEITEITKIVSICPKKMLEEVLDYIYYHNNLCYELMLSDLYELSHNSDTSLKILLAKFGYNYDELKKDTHNFLKKRGYEEIKQILENIRELEISIPGDFIPFISLNKMLKIKELITKNILNVEFISKRPCILFRDNSILAGIINNIKILNSLGVNISNYHHSLDILLYNIWPNLRVLASYGLSITKDTKDISFLKDSNMTDKINIIIIMGKYHELKSLDILNKDIRELIRYRVYQRLNIPIDSNIDFYNSNDYGFSEANSLVPKNYQEIFNRDLGNEVELPSYLESFKENNYTLNINGIYVSIKLLLDNLGKLDCYDQKSLYYAIIYNANYTIEEAIMLEDYLLSIEKENGRVLS